jgi:hypothetical protein
MSDFLLISSSFCSRKNFISASRANFKRDNSASASIRVASALRRAIQTKNSLNFLYIQKRKEIFLYLVQQLLLLQFEMIQHDFVLQLLLDLLIQQQMIKLVIQEVFFEHLQLQLHL